MNPKDSTSNPVDLAPKPKATDASATRRAWWDALSRTFVGRTFVSLFFPVKYTRGLIAYSVLVFLLMVFSGGPVPVVEFLRKSGPECLKVHTVGTCAAQGHEIALDEISKELAGGVPVKTAASMNTVGLSAMPPRGLDGSEEAVLLVPNTEENAQAYLCALVEGGDRTLVRIGSDSYEFDLRHWRVVGLDIRWTQARGWRETALREELAAVLALFVCCFSMPLWMVIPVLQASLNALRSRQVPVLIRSAISISIQPLRFITTYLVAVLFISIILGFGLLSINWAWSCLNAMTLRTPGWLTAETALDGLVAISLAALWFTFLDACESLNWVAEVPDLEPLLRASVRPHAAGNTATTTLEDREVLRAIDIWPVHKDGRRVLLNLGISPPALPWRDEFLRPTGMPDEIMRRSSLAAWRHHLGIETLPIPVAESDKTSTPAQAAVQTPPVEIKHEEAEDNKVRRLIDEREATARHQRVERLQRLIADGYILIQPTRLVLSDLGRSTLALPALSMVDEIPFALRRDLAVIEALVMRGSAQAAIQQCGRFLERYLKELLVTHAPKIYPSPEWCDEAFTRGWVGMLGERDESPSGSARGVFIDKVQSVLRSTVVNSPAPKGWSEQEWAQIGTALEATGHDASRAAPALRALATGMLKDNRASKALREYLRVSGVPDMAEEMSPADKQRWEAFSREVPRRVRETPCGAVVSEYGAWQTRFGEEMERATLHPLLTSTSALLECLIPTTKEARQDRQPAAELASALAHQWVAANKICPPIVDARNQAAHDRSDGNAHIDKPEEVSLALHTLWLTRIFVASVEKVRVRPLSVQTPTSEACEQG